MKIIECPRDAMQGLEKFIPTERKIGYLNQLLEIGFDTLDCGSFVSAKAIPQLKDTAEVLNGLNVSTTKLLVIVANTRGAEEACRFESIRYLGFPLSLSETFQKRNTNKSIAEALNSVEAMQNICIRSHKQLVIYLSMGFGNPYGDPYDEGIVAQFTDILSTLEIKIVSLADTIGVSTPGQITSLFTSLIPQFPSIEFGAHLHSNPATAVEKISAAFDAGCQRFDGAIKGFGGCPMAEDELVGNLATETIVAYLESKGVNTGLNNTAFQQALLMADTVFAK
jgi:hydroxymethylglutaryl-CoA lyase